MEHRRFRNPEKGYSRLKDRVETQRVVAELVDDAARAKPNATEVLEKPTETARLVYDDSASIARIGDGRVVQRAIARLFGQLRIHR